MTESELLDRIEELEAERDYWKGEAEVQASDDVRHRLRVRFALTPTEAWVLAVLYQRGGRSVRRSFLAESLPGKDPDDRIGNTVQVLVHRLRGKLRGNTIETVRQTYGGDDGGYRLTATGVEFLREVIN